jgi:hypothetical protein
LQTILILSVSKGRGRGEESGGRHYKWTLGAVLDTLLFQIKLNSQDNGIST